MLFRSLGLLGGEGGQGDGQGFQGQFLHIRTHDLLSLTCSRVPSGRTMTVLSRIPVIEAEKSKLDAITAGASHQGIVALAPKHEYSSLDDILKYASDKGESPFIVILDELEDPHNLGAILRNADAAGAHGVIIPKRRSVGLTGTVSKASAGAIEHVKVAKVTNISQTIDALKEKGLWIYGADMDGSEYYKTDFTGGVALVLGSEGFGISRLVREKCDFIVSIPMYGMVNSMNVSCAGAVLLTEIARQRHIKKGV